MRRSRRRRRLRTTSSTPRGSAHRRYVTGIFRSFATLPGLGMPRSCCGRLSFISWTTRPHGSKEKRQDDSFDVSCCDSWQDLRSLAPVAIRVWAVFRKTRRQRCVLMGCVLTNPEVNKDLYGPNKTHLTAQHSYHVPTLRSSVPSLQWLFRGCFSTLLVHFQLGPWGSCR
jgi:hypothetical protein